MERFLNIFFCWNLNFKNYKENSSKILVVTLRLLGRICTEILGKVLEDSLDGIASFTENFLGEFERVPNEFHG